MRQPEGDFLHDVPKLRAAISLGGSVKGIRLFASFVAERILRVKFNVGVSAEDRFKHVVNLLIQLVEDGLRDEYVRRKAVEVVNSAGIRGHDELGEIRAIVKWVQNNAIYRKDPTNVEYFQTARRLIKDIESGRSASDCDDHVILGASLLGALGYEVGALVVDSSGDGVLNHVMLVVKTFAPTPQFGNKWIPAELIFPDFALGESVRVSQVYPLIGNPTTARTPIMMQSLSGLAGHGRSMVGGALAGYEPPVVGLIGAIRRKIR